MNRGTHELGMGDIALLSNRVLIDPASSVEIYASTLANRLKS